MVPGLYECAAQLRHRSVVSGAVRHMVGEQRSRFRSRWYGSGTAGGFVRRVAHTPHYDGVRKGAKEPVVIGIFGIAPVELKLVDPSKPPWRLA